VPFAPENVPESSCSLPPCSQVLGRYTVRSEVYAFGMVLLELLTDVPVTAAGPVPTANRVEAATNDGKNPEGLVTLMQGEAE
jgi:hypothetical protein